MNVMRLAVAFAAGAAAMYLFDPITGRRRRALLRDQGVAAGHDLEDLVEAKTKRTVDHMRGAAAEARARRRNEPISDERLEARIRSELGRLVQRPSAVEVAVQDGDVVLSGQVRSGELEEVVEHVSAMQGVAHVENQLGVDRPT